MSQSAHAAKDYLVPPGLRRAAGLTVGLCVLIAAAIGAMFAHHTQPSGLDNAVWNALPYPWGPSGLNGNGARLLHYLDLLRQLGGPVPITVLTALLCYCCIAMRRYRAALMVASCEIVASALTEFVLKPITDRTLNGSLSYPSSHTTAAFALATAVVLLLADPSGTRMPRSMRIVLSLVTVGTAALVAFGVIAWHQHYFTDVIGGAAVGTGVTVSVALLIDLLVARHSSVAATAPAGPVPEVQSAKPG